MPDEIDRDDRRQGPEDLTPADQAAKIAADECGEGCGDRLRERCFCCSPQQFAQNIGDVPKSRILRAPLMPS